MAETRGGHPRQGLLPAALSCHGKCTYRGHLMWLSVWPSTINGTESRVRGGNPRATLVAGRTPPASRSAVFLGRSRNRRWALAGSGPARWRGDHGGTESSSHDVLLVCLATTSNSRLNPTFCSVGCRGPSTRTATGSSAPPSRSSPATWCCSAGAATRPARGRRCSSSRMSAHRWNDTCRVGRSQQAPEPGYGDAGRGVQFLMRACVNGPRP